MKKNAKKVIALVLAAALMFAFTGCGEKTPELTPMDEAQIELETFLNTIQSADMESLKALGNADSIAKAVEQFGSEEATQTVVTALFGHFDYKIGDGEQVDDTHINFPVTVTNVDMHKAVKTWFTEMLTAVGTNPAIAKDEEALLAKTIETMAAAIDKTAEEENGLVSTDVTLPMVYEGEKWTVSGEIDSSVTSAILGGLPEALAELQQQTNNG